MHSNPVGAQEEHVVLNRLFRGQQDKADLGPVVAAFIKHFLSVN